MIRTTTEHKEKIEQAAHDLNIAVMPAYHDAKGWWRDETDSPNGPYLTRDSAQMLYTTYHQTLGRVPGTPRGVDRG